LSKFKVVKTVSVFLAVSIWVLLYGIFLTEILLLVIKLRNVFLAQW